MSVLSLAFVPGDASAQFQQQRRPQGAAASSKQATVKVLPAGVIGNFVSPEIATEATFSPDGKVVALSTFSSGIMLWDTASGRLVRVLSQRPHFMASAFTEDGRQMVTGHKDGTLRIWDIETGAVSAPLSVPRGKGKTGKDAPGKVEDPDPIRTVWIDPRGELFVVSDGAGNVAVWSLTSKKPTLNIPNRSGGSSPIIHDARISADGASLIVLASKTYKGVDTVTTYSAQSGAQLSTYDLPEKHNFIDNSIVREDEAIVLYSSPECELGELVLFSLKDKSVIVPVYRPAVCAKPKDGADPAELKVFHGPDSTSLLITRDDDPDLRIFDVATRRLTNTFRWPAVAKPQVLGVSGDMRLVATKEPEGVSIRELATGKQVKDLRSFAVYSDAMLSNADGSQFLVQRSAPEGSKAPVDVSLRKLEEVRPVTFQIPSADGWKIQDFASAANLAIASNDKGEVALIPLDGKPLRKLAVQALKEATVVRLSPDGKTAILNGRFNNPKAKDPDDADLYGQVIDVANGAIRQKIESKEDAEITGIAFSADGSQFALGMRNGAAEIWETASIKKIKSLPAPKEDADVRAIAFSPDGKALIGAGMFDDDVFVWNLDTGKVQRIYKMPSGLAGYRYATSVAMSRDRKIVAAGLGQRHVSSGDMGPERGGIHLWDADTGKLRTTLRNQRGAITALAFSPNDKWIVSGSLDGSIQYWDRNTGRPLATAVAGPNGRWIVLGEGGFYAGSDGLDDAVNVTRGTAAATGPAVAKILSRPDLVDALFKGDNAKLLDGVKKLDLSTVAP
ncbi:MAG: WD40 repeat domain-containing protein [Pseudorhodoplanes sp.]